VRTRSEQHSRATISAVQVRCAGIVLVLSAVTLAQNPPCPAETPVDEIIAELNKQQPKKASRNTNPVPENVCIFGWCRQTGRTPPTIPKPAPREQTPSATPGDEETSSSKKPAETCDEAMQMAVEAARDVDIGDYYFDKKNFNGAWMRYKDAASEKPSDVAIHVRLGRVLEKLNRPPQAIEEYKAAEKLSGPEKWTAEARAALARLQRTPGQ